MCEELKIKDTEEIISLYSIFSGFPKYYVAIEDENLGGMPFEGIVEKFFFVDNALFEEEVEKILSLELGKRRGVYYDILTAIANGENTISKIASYLNQYRKLSLMYFECSYPCLPSHSLYLL